MNDINKYINYEYMKSINELVVKYKDVIGNNSLTPALMTTLLTELDKKGILSKEDFLKGLEKDLKSWGTHGPK